MAEYTQIPGELDLKIARGDNLSIGLDFNLDLTGYQFVASIKKDTTTISMLVTTVDLAEGQINISLTGIQTNQLLENMTWRLRWTDPGGAIRTILKGKVMIDL